MSIPSREEAARIVQSFNPKPFRIAHSATVADIASFLATAIDRRGHAIHIPLVEASALLHDVDKTFPANDPLRALPHGEGGAAWLRDNGYDELAGPVANHPVIRLADDQHFNLWIREATVEERVVAYADKRAQEDIVPLEQRFARWVEEHGDTDVLRVARERAQLLEKEVCAAAGIEPADVERANWALAALETALAALQTARAAR